jgi:hypothetical protein
MLKFRTWKYENGIQTTEKIIIDLPKFCCNIETSIIQMPLYSVDCIVSGCYVHMNNWKSIWDSFGQKVIFDKKCVSCQIYNEYAESNFKDNKYKCWSCKNWC